MPKIFVLRHQLAEQQAKLRQHDKGGESSNGSPSLSSDEETRGETVVVQPASVLLAPAVLQSQQPSEVCDILQRPPPGLVIQPIPPPLPQPQSSAASTSSTAAGKHT